MTRLSLKSAQKIQKTPSTTVLYTLYIEHPETGLVATMDTKHIANIAQNRVVLKFIIEAILFCAKQCIALRGDCEDLESSKKPSNFLSILKLMSNHIDNLRTHFYSPAMKNAIYISPRMQNELLNIMGRHIVLFEIVQEIKTAKVYSILADEVTSHNTEHLALCTRLVGAKGDTVVLLLRDHPVGLNFNGLPRGVVCNQGVCG